MLVSQTYAIRILREQTQYSIVECTRRVMAMPRIRDNKREKIHIASLNVAIRDMNAPPKPVDVGIKGLSEKHKARIRATAITRNAVEMLMSRAAGK